MAQQAHAQGQGAPSSAKYNLNPNAQSAGPGPSPHANQGPHGGPSNIPASKPLTSVGGGYLQSSAKSATSGITPRSNAPTPHAQQQQGQQQPPNQNPNSA